MTRSNQNKHVANAILEYENLDLPPAYVDGAQGVLSPSKDVLHVSFFSERTAGLPKLSVTPKKIGDGKSYKANFGDSFGLDTGNVRFTRRVEANLIFTQKSLEKIIPWLQKQLEDLQNGGQVGE